MKFIKASNVGFQRDLLREHDCNVQDLNGSMKEPNILMYFFFLPITQWCSLSDIVSTGGRGVSDFSVLQYY